MDENQVLELVEFYEDMIEKQDEIIVRQSRFIKSLATELSHLRNMLNVEASEDERLDAGIIEEVSIIILCLGAESDSVIIIENPEIHLHPKAQSKLCEFLYFVSQSGRQLFIETHSDHIFNGLRVGVANGSMNQEDISVNFFAMNEQYETQCNPIIFKEYGKIVGTNEDMDIDDLFDQFEIDLNRMFGL